MESNWKTFAQVSYISDVCEKKNLTNISLDFHQRRQQCLKLSSDWSSLQSKLNIIEDFNINLNISHEIYTNPDYFTSTIYIISHLHTLQCLHSHLILV